MELRDFIYVGNHIPRELCEEMIEKTEMLSWTPHQWSSYDRDAGQNVDVGTEENDPLIARFPDENHNSALRDCVHEAIGKHYGYSLNLCGLRFNRYPLGASLRKHIDHITSVFDGTRKGIPILSVIGQLNEDYEGGQLVINDEVIPMKQGDICLFPSVYLYPHEITPVSEGERISFVGWTY